MSDDATKQWPEKVWLIFGYHSPRHPEVYTYTTDPRYYCLPNLKTLTDAEYEKIADRLCVFVVADDAINFVYECGMDSRITGWRLVNGQYQKDDEVGAEVWDTAW